MRTHRNDDLIQCLERLVLCLALAFGLAACGHVESSQATWSTSDILPSAIVGTPAATAREPTRTAQSQPATSDAQTQTDTAPAAPPIAAGWQNYRNVQAGYIAAYPSDWIISQQTSTGTSTTTFRPAGTSDGITVRMQLGDAEPGQPIDRQPNKSCQPTIVAGLRGMRCLNLISFAVPTGTPGELKLYTINTTKGVDQNLYQRFLESFALLSS